MLCENVNGVLHYAHSMEPGILMAGMKWNAHQFALLCVIVRQYVRIRTDKKRVTDDYGSL